MNKQRLLNMSYDLNIKLAYSDIEGEINFRTFDDGAVGITFIHISDYYEHSNKALRIFEFYEEEKALRIFEHIKEVIAGGRLVTDEADSHVPN